MLADGRKHRQRGRQTWRKFSCRDFMLVMVINIRHIKIQKQISYKSHQDQQTNFRHIFCYTDLRIIRAEPTYSSRFNCNQTILKVMDPEN